jgi:hypothetical protein
VADVAEKSAHPLEAASRRAAEMVEQLTGSVVGSLATSTTQLAADTAKLSKSAGEISAALDVVATKLSDMRTPEGVVEVRLDPVIASLTQAIDRFTEQSQGQAAATRDVVAATKIAAESASASIIALRQEIAASSATNGATLERSTGILTAMAQVLDEFEADAAHQAEVLRVLLERTDATMRGFAELLVKSGTDMALQTTSLRDMLPTLQAGLPTPASETERTADVAGDMGTRHAALKREAMK